MHLQKGLVVFVEVARGQFLLDLEAFQSVGVVLTVQPFVDLVIAARLLDPGLPAFREDTRGLGYSLHCFGGGVSIICINTIVLWFLEP